MFSTLSASALAQTYPSRPIHMVVPYPVGGATDILGRLLGKKLGELLGQSVVIENRAGAGTVIGANYVAKSAPDGYTLLITAGTTTLTINPAIQSKLPYDPVKSFEPIGFATRLPLVLIANPSFPAKTLKEVVQAGKATPGKLSYGSFGEGSTAHFAGELLWYAVGAKIVHVPYKGSAPAMNDLIGGQIPLAIDTVTAAAPQIKAGTVTAIAVTTKRRSALLPNVPTVEEQGYPGVNVDAWSVLVAPRGLPPTVKARLEKALSDTVNDPAIQKQLIANGFEPAYGNAASASALIERELPQMRAIAQRAGIRAD
ncbi:tripartite tricarboxylate transporter substrate binding protein (plasmid) [Cupriavidus metallidurans]|uniref:Bug family tripartite tricarboxylate transporter substrate binding protein n=1 Tax=Cupriavidus metallidurans TaxID=119219 RepID=UPI003D7355F3